MRVDILGCRGSSPATGPEFVRYGGDTSCVAVSAGDGPPTLVLDAGTGLRHLSALLDRRAFDGSILLSHLHWDHTHGLPFCPAVDHDDARVDLYLPAQGVDPITVLGGAMGPPHFPIGPAELRGEWRFLALDEGRHQVSGFEVLAREIPHKGGRTFGYRVTHGDRSLAYLPDHGPGPPGSDRSGLGVLHQAAIDLAHGVDLLIHDAQYTTAEYGARHCYGHAAAAHAVELGRAARVDTVLLFHHEPTRTDDDLDTVIAPLATTSADGGIDGGPSVRVAVQGDRYLL